MDPINYGNASDNFTVEPYVTSYEYTNTYYAISWSDGTVENHDYYNYYGNEGTDYSSPQPGYSAED
jgi:hypothetical protein